MGLDQYLFAKKYIGCWGHSADEDWRRYDAILSALGKSGWRCESSPSLTVEVSTLYWRKANQIHQWFVENVQGGEDDCKTYYVTEAQLETLRNTCKMIMASTRLVAGKIVNGRMMGPDGIWKDVIEDGQRLENSTVANALLPTQAGFFFGSTDYDERYWHDLNYTAAGINTILTEFNGWDFYYSSSW
jgi:hypothetical protein